MEGDNPVPADDEQSPDHLPATGEGRVQIRQAEFDLPCVGRIDWRQTKGPEALGLVDVQLIGGPPRAIADGLGEQAAGLVHALKTIGPSLL